MLQRASWWCFTTFVSLLLWAGLILTAGFVISWIQLDHAYGQTATHTSVYTATNTNTPANTPTRTPTAVNTATVTVTATSTATPTNTLTWTPTGTRRSTPTQTPPPAPTSTATSAPTSTTTATPVATFTRTAMPTSAVPKLPLQFPGVPSWSVGYYKLPVVVNKTTTGASAKVTAGWGHKTYSVIASGTTSYDVNCQPTLGGATIKILDDKTASEHAQSDVWCDAVWIDAATCTTCSLTLIVYGWR